MINKLCEPEPLEAIDWAVAACLVFAKYAGCYLNLITVGVFFSHLVWSCLITLPIPVFVQSADNFCETLSCSNDH